MIRRLVRAVFLPALLVILPCGVSTAWDNSELSVSAWGEKTDNWSKIQNSNIPVYALLVKDKKTYRFSRFSNVPDASQAWVHLPSRKPTWNTYLRYCAYRLIGQRTCPTYAPNQFMDRDVSFIGATIGGLISFGLVPLTQGVGASFEFEPKAYQKAVDEALKNSNVDPAALEALSVAWATLKSREAEGDKLVDTANYSVKVTGTGNGALKGISAKGLVEPALQYPWAGKNGLGFDTYKDFHDTITTMADKFGRKPLNEFVPLASVCPGKRGERVVGEAVCTQTVASWEGSRINVTGDMEVTKWKLVPPRFVRFDSDEMNMDYDQGMVTFTNKSPKSMDVVFVSIDFFGKQASARLVGKRLQRLSSARFVGFVSNGSIRTIEKGMPVVTPEALEDEVRILARADYLMGLLTMKDFSVAHELKGSELIRSELEQLQAVGKPLPVSILDREYVAVSIKQ